LSKTKRSTLPSAGRLGHDHQREKREARGEASSLAVRLRGSEPPPSLTHSSPTDALALTPAPNSTCASVLEVKGKDVAHASRAGAALHIVLNIYIHRFDYAFFSPAQVSALVSIEQAEISHAYIHTYMHTHT